MQKNILKYSAILALVALVALVAPAAAEGPVWGVDLGKSAIVLQGVADGSYDIAWDYNTKVPFGPFQFTMADAVSNGVVVEYKTVITGTIAGCFTTVYKDAVFFANLGNCDGTAYEIGPGTIRLVHDASHKNTGSRWSPLKGTGWKATDSRQTCPPLDGDEVCWNISADGKNVGWLGQDGAADVNTVRAPKAEAAIKSGAMLSITTNYTFTVEACVLTASRRQSDGTYVVVKTWGKCELDKNNLPTFQAGSYQFSNSIGTSGSYRIHFLGYVAPTIPLTVTLPYTPSVPLTNTVPMTK